MSLSSCDSLHFLGDITNYISIIMVILGNVRQKDLI